MVGDKKIGEEESVGRRQLFQMGGGGLQLMVRGDDLPIPTGKTLGIPLLSSKGEIQLC